MILLIDAVMMPIMLFYKNSSYIKNYNNLNNLWRIMNNLFFSVFLLLFTMNITACRSKEEKVTDALEKAGKKIVEEENKSAAKIDKATENLQKTEAEVNKDIAEKQKELEEEKIEATKKIADAEAKVDEKKIDATESEAEVKKDAIEDVEKAIK